MLERLFRQVMYVRFSPERIHVRDPRSGRAVDEPPLVAILDEGKRKSVAATGGEAAKMRGRPGAVVRNPFEPARIVIGDFVLAEQLLKLLARRVLPGSWMRAAPTVVVHPERRFEGGLTQLEVRALQELAIGATGAPRVIVWEGPALTDEQLLRLDLPTTGTVLEDSASGPRRR